MGRIVRMVVRPGDSKRLTPEQIRELEEMEKAPIVFDEDDREYSYEELLEMAEAAKRKRAEEKRKELVTIRMSKATLDKAKAVGKGYTGFLARLVENAMEDKELVAKSL